MAPRAEVTGLRQPDCRVGGQSTVRPNARSEGQKGIVKHIGRNAFGFRSPNQRRRVHWACTR